MQPAARQPRVGQPYGTEARCILPNLALPKTLKRIGPYKRLGAYAAVVFKGNQDAAPYLEKIEHRAGLDSQFFKEGDIEVSDVSRKRSST